MRVRRTPRHRGVTRNEMAGQYARQSVDSLLAYRVDRGDRVSVAFFEWRKAERVVDQWWKDIVKRNGKSRALLVPDSGPGTGKERSRIRPQLQRASEVVASRFTRRQGATP